MDDKERKYLMTRRQCLIMELGAIEDMLDMERSIVPKRKRVDVPPVVTLTNDGYIPDASEVWAAVNR